MFFSNLGTAYVMRIDDVPATTGYGEPVQKLFKFGDGERVVGGAGRRRRGAAQGDAGRWRSRKRGLRPALRARARTASCRPAPGRRFAKPARGRRDRRACCPPARRTSSGVGDRASARALLCKADEVAELAGPGRGVTVIKVGDERRRGRLRRRRREGRGRPRSPRPTAARRSRSGPGRYEVTAPRRQGPRHATRKAHGRERDGRPRRRRRRRQLLN